MHITYSYYETCEINFASDRDTTVTSIMWDAKHNAGEASERTC